MRRDSRAPRHTAAFEQPYPIANRSMVKSSSKRDQSRSGDLGGKGLSRDSSGAVTSPARVEPRSRTVATRPRRVSPQSSVAVCHIEGPSPYRPDLQTVSIGNEVISSLATIVGFAFEEWGTRMSRVTIPTREPRRASFQRVRAASRPASADSRRSARSAQAQGVRRAGTAHPGSPECRHEGRSAPAALE